jgi:hypothetical protein
MHAMFYNATSFGKSLCWSVPPTANTVSIFDNTNGANFDPTYPSCL